MTSPKALSARSPIPYEELQAFEDLETTIQRAKEIALVVNETAMELHRGGQDQWTLTNAGSGRLTVFVILMCEEIEAAHRQIKELIG